MQRTGRTRPEIVVIDYFYKLGDAALRAKEISCKVGSLAGAAHLLHHNTIVNTYK